MLNHIRVEPLIGALGFFILYPVFFIYHLAIANSFISASLVSVVKGLYGPAAVVIVLLYAASSVPINDLMKNRIGFISQVFWLYLLWALIWILFNMFTLKTYYAVDASIQISRLLILQIANFAIGSMMVLRSNGKFFYALVLSWAGMVFFTFLSVESETLNFQRSLAYNGEVAIASYQGFARSLMITALLILALVQNIHFRLIIAILSVVTLFFIGARSEFIGFCCGVMILECVLLILNPRNIIALLGYFIASLLVALLFFQEIFLFVEGSRILNIFSLNFDQSWNTREIYTQYAVESIVSNPVDRKSTRLNSSH